MIELNYTLWVQMVNFLAIMIILHFLLYRPMKKLFEERDRRVNSALAEAESLRRQANDLLAGYDDAIKSAKAEAHTEFVTLCRDGGAELKRLTESAREVVLKDAQAAMAEISNEKAAAREALRGQMDAIARQIAGKLVGRAL